MDQPRPASQKFPAGLAGVLNPEDNRDSAYYSSTDASSKHTSAASGMGVPSPTGSGFGFHSSPIDKTPSPTSTASNLVPQALVSPINSNMSVASMVSPTSPGSADPRRFDRPQSLDSAPNSATFGAGEGIPESMSRRESVDSSVNQGFGSLRLGSSPYASHNQSTTSIHNTLQQQRNPRPGLESLSLHRMSNGYRPDFERNPEGHPKQTRVAPAITGPAKSQIARAAEPTKGQAWAFPEEEIHRVPSHGQSLIGSRRSSVADSLASSQYTTESRYPPGQRVLDDGLLGSEFQRHHHHSLQNKQLESLQNEEAGGAGGQPYSRTPELRVSHKLAERKRRTEMKELFDTLRDLMPQERGSKASKWEILTKAINEHQRQSEIINKLHTLLTSQNAEIASLKRDMEKLHDENERLRRGDQYGPPRPELPPLRALQSGAVHAGPESMTGVQYDQHVRNGYRPADHGAY